MTDTRTYTLPNGGTITVRTGSRADREFARTYPSDAPVSPAQATETPDLPVDADTPETADEAHDGDV